MSVILISLGFYNKNSTQTVWLKRQKLISHNFGRWNSETRVSAWWVLGEGHLLVLQKTISLYPHFIERKEVSSLLCLLKSALVPPETSYLITSPKSPISKYYHTGHQSFNMPILGKQTSSKQQTLWKKKKKKTRVGITTQQVWDLIEDEEGINNQKYSTVV